MYRSILSKRFYFGTIKQFRLPDLGEKIKEATIKKWLVKEGDNVKDLAEVATDKLHTSIPSEFNGKVHRLLYKEEEMCQVGQLLLEIEIEDTTPGHKNVVQLEVDTPKQKQNGQQAIVPNNSEQQLNFATPAVRSMIKQFNIKMDLIKGSGDQGRILKSDVLNYIQLLEKPKQNVKEQSPQQVNSIIPQQTNTQEQKLGSTKSKMELEVVKMTDFQKGMQKSMTQSNLIPHFYLMEEIDVSELAELRDSFKSSLNLNITFMPFFIKTFSLALNEFPIINSLYDAEIPFEYKTCSNHNISIAMDTPKGLVVPNIQNVQNLSIFEINNELLRLKDLAAAGKLSGKELFNGTISLSNIGNIAGTYTGPLIMPPQVAIVGIGRIQKVPKYVKIDKNVGHKEELVARKLINITFGGDHRVLDGATVAKFVRKWKQYLENPQNILLHLK